MTVTHLKGGGRKASLFQKMLKSKSNVDAIKRFLYNELTVFTKYDKRKGGR